MGDKIEAKRTAKRLGIPVVPGSDGGITDDVEALKVAARSAFPVLVKAAAGGGGRGMKVARYRRRSVDRALDRAHRSEGRLRRRRGLSRKIPRRARATSKSRCWATARATPSISASGIVRCSAATRRSGGKPLARAQSRSARQDRRGRRQGDARPAISRRRHRRVSVRGRRVLFHRNEHAHPGRASGDRDDHRHRSRAGTDPRRRRRRTSDRAEGRALPRPRHRVPRQRGEPDDLPALARKDPALSSAGRARRARRFRACIRATRSRRSTTRWSAS